MKWLLTVLTAILLLAVWQPIMAEVVEIEWASVPTLSEDGTYTIEIKNDLPQLQLFAPKGQPLPIKEIKGTRTGGVTKFVFKKPKPQYKYFNFHKGKDLWGFVSEGMGSGVVGTTEFAIRGKEETNWAFRLMNSPTEKADEPLPDKE